MSLPSEEGDRSGDEIDPEDSEGADDDGPSVGGPENAKTPPIPTMEPRENKPLVGYLTVHQPDGQMLNVPVQVDPSVLIKCSSGSSAVVSGTPTMTTSHISTAVKVGELFTLFFNPFLICSSRQPDFG